MAKYIFSTSCKTFLFFLFIALGSVIFYKHFNDVPKDRVLKIAMRDDNAPFNVKTSKLTLKGFNVDLLKFFFNDLHVSYEVVPVDADEIVSSVSLGLFDIGVSSSSELEKVDNKELLNDILVTNAYIESQNVVVTKNSDGNFLKYKKIGIIRDDSLKDVYKNHFKKSQILEYENFDDMFKAFNSNETQALILNSLVLKRAILKHKIKDFVLNTKFFDGIKNKYVLIFPKDSVYFSIINKKLGKFKSKNKFKLVYQKWFGND